MADDAGALLVRSGLVPSSALDDARVRVANHGGTIGEQLVAAGVIADDALTDFYRSRLLVPLVNPNTLARLPVRVIAAIPSDMAIELRAVPVSLDNDNNLTVAMSDPSDSHAVDEIAFFTGTYVVRAVATQMQIAWCLAHYYGHVTPLAQRLLQPSSEPEVAAPPKPPAVPPPIPRTKGHTAKIDATRHRAIAPGQQVAVDLPRPRSGELDLPKLTAEAEAGAKSKAQAPLRAVSEPDIADDGAPDRPRARSISGEIRVPSRRAQSIRPPMPPPIEDHDDDDDEHEPLITVVAANPDEDATGPRMVAIRRRVKTDPPELAARAGEVDIATGPVRRVDLDEPRIIINDEPPKAADVSGELRVVVHRNDASVPSSTIEISDDTNVGVVIHEHLSRDSEPVLLERRRPSDPPTIKMPTEEAEDVVVLDARKPRPQRSEKRTQVGIGALPAVTRSHHDTETSGIPTVDADEAPTGSQREAIDPTTRVNTRAVPPSPFDTTDDMIAAPPSMRDADTSPIVAPPLPAKRATPTPPRPVNAVPQATSDDDDGDPLTSVMSAVELDDAIPERNAEVVPAHLARRAEPNQAAAVKTIDYDPVDDGWGPPGTTIPPPLLGAIPGSEGDDESTSRIPMPDVDSAPLIVAPPTPPEPAGGRPATDSSGPSLVRALEEATSRSIELIHALERTHSRDDVIDLMSSYVSVTHRRSGFFSIKGGELAIFSIHPKPELLSVTTLRLDRPSTLQDVVGTRLPYRGPMHDDASRNFLASVLGACPPEILLVPVAIRERVVGVLFGEQRMRHTFDDQLALAGRAAGMALERIMKSKRT